MKRKIFIYFFLPFLLLIISGCVPLMVGGAVGAVGAYAVSKDTIEGETDKPYDSLWNSVLTVSKIRGTIKQEDGSRGYVELETDSSRVWIRLVRLTRATTRIRISARNKFHLPQLELAQDMYVKILEDAR